ncbi:hypothetical protein ABT158_20740 [Nonomuraea sp. NPDC001636]|uniref:hypothetical protein n=1 Tax=Nonomuraea sp. NPDC001636 TaxID=3154391 RepID=UPI0033328284
MLRTTTSLTGLATAAALVLSLAAPASAATGTLYINRAQYDDPSGCYTSDSPNPFVYNRTDELAIVFLRPDCQGPVTGTVPPNDGQEIVGTSVFIR